MTPYEIEKAIFDYLTANWTATSIREINKGTGAELPFIECHCLPGQVLSAEIQGVGVRFGIFQINIYTALGVGVQEGGVYAGLIEQLFWHLRVGDVVCENGTLLPYTESLGKDAEMQAFRHKVVVPFFVIEEK